MLHALIFFSLTILFAILSLTVYFIRNCPLFLTTLHYANISLDVLRNSENFQMYYVTSMHCSQCEYWKVRPK